jgi:tetratricopeptide (TPR) repeat protein
VRARSADLSRVLFVCSLLLAAAPRLEAQLSSADLEEASEVARRAAGAALRGQIRVLSEALDLDGILERHIGGQAWAQLTPRQRQQLRSVVLQTFAAPLSPPRPAGGEIAWSSAREEGPGAAVFLGIRFGDRWLKTRWSLRRSVAGGWRVEDVTLSDPGVSLASEALRSLGDHPVTRRDRRRQARQEAYPRLLGLAAIALIFVFAYRRLSPPGRKLLLLTAPAPALLFLVDGALAVRRALAEPYAISMGAPAPVSARWLRMARDAQREGRLEDAEPLWDRALAAGAAPAPIAYERGLAARDQGDLDRAAREFHAALDAAPPAPGAARELALLALSEGKSGEASDWIGRYIAAAGPDPDALAIEAVIQTNLGHPDEALAVILQARELVGGGVRGSELEARVRARTSDAAGAVAALRELEPLGRLDREALRADPAYLPIAADPVWVAFLNEKSAPPPVSTPASAR